MRQTFDIECKNLGESERKGNTDQNLPIKAGLADNDREGALVVVVGSRVHVEVQTVVAATDRGDRRASHRVRREVRCLAIAIV